MKQPKTIQVSISDLEDILAEIHEIKLELYRSKERPTKDEIQECIHHRVGGELNALSIYEN